MDYPAEQENKLVAIWSGEDLSLSSNERGPRRAAASCERLSLQSSYYVNAR